MRRPSEARRRIARRRRPDSRHAAAPAPAGSGSRGVARLRGPPVEPRRVDAGALAHVGRPLARRAGGRAAPSPARAARSRGRARRRSRGPARRRAGAPARAGPPAPPGSRRAGTASASRAHCHGGPPPPPDDAAAAGAASCSSAGSSAGPGVLGLGRLDGGVLEAAEVDLEAARRVVGRRDRGRVGRRAPRRRVERQPAVAREPDLHPRVGVAVEDDPGRTAPCRSGRCRSPRRRARGCRPSAASPPSRRRSAGRSPAGSMSRKSTSGGRSAGLAGAVGQARGVRRRLVVDVAAAQVRLDAVDRRVRRRGVADDLAREVPHGRVRAEGVVVGRPGSPLPQAGTSTGSPPYPPRRRVDDAGIAAGSYGPGVHELGRARAREARRAPCSRRRARAARSSCTAPAASRAVPAKGPSMRRGRPDRSSTCELAPTSFTRCETAARRSPRPGRASMALSRDRRELLAGRSPSPGRRAGRRRRRSPRARRRAGAGCSRRRRSARPAAWWASRAPRSAG